LIALATLALGARGADALRPGAPATSDEAPRPSSAERELQRNLDLLWPVHKPAPVRREEAPETPLPKIRPVPLSCPPPSYPPASIRDGEEGQVLVRMQIAATGRVCAVEVVHSSGFPRLDEAAVSAVRAWRFAPMTDGRSSVKVQIEHPLAFQLVAKR
jgi:periplasmic protein TonB